MRVKYLTLDAGPDGTNQVGSTRDVSDEEAAALVDGGYAEYVGEPPVKGKKKKVETATDKTDTETATTR